MTCPADTINPTLGSDRHGTNLCQGLGFQSSHTADVWDMGNNFFFPVLNCAEFLGPAVTLGQVTDLPSWSEDLGIIPPGAIQCTGTATGQDKEQLATS